MSTLNLRRLRQDEHVRSLTREIHVRSDQLIQPLFVAEGLTKPAPIPGLTGVHQETADSLLRQIEHDIDAGVRKFLLFGVPTARSERHIDWSFTAGQIEAIKARFGRDIWLATDVCLCSSTPHGHCGVLNAEGDHVDNDASLAELVAAALAYAKAGADCVAPSDMMDDRIGAIRSSLDGGGCERTVLMSYAVKFQSALYGPFRLAADAAPKGATRLKDRATYQLDPARPGDAWLCAQRDAQQGADILMVKPGLPCLDIVRRVVDAFHMPTFAFQVSGEYAMIAAAAANGWIDGERAILESLAGFKRAGCAGVITYFAPRAAELLGA